MSRPFSAGAFNFLVGSPELHLTELVETAFQDLPVPALAGDELPCFVLDPSRNAEGARTIDLSGPVIGAMSGLTLPGAMTMLMMGVSREARDAEPEYLHLHAAAAVREGRAVGALGSSLDGQDDDAGASGHAWMGFHKR